METIYTKTAPDAIGPYSSLLRLATPSIPLVRLPSIRQPER